MKARNPRNTVAATNPVFDLLMTSYDLNDLNKNELYFEITLQVDLLI